MSKEQVDDLKQLARRVQIGRNYAAKLCVCLFCCWFVIFGEVRVRASKTCKERKEREKWERGKNSNIQTFFLPSKWFLGSRKFVHSPRATGTQNARKDTSNHDVTYLASSYFPLSLAEA